MANRRKNYAIGKFSLSREHVELSFLAGVSREDLVDQYLENIEIDLKLKPGSLAVYYYERHKDYLEYWYTEDANERYINEFENKIYSFGKVEAIKN